LGIAPHFRNCGVFKNRRIKMQMKQPQKPQQPAPNKAPEKKPQAPAPQQKQKVPGK
jgi:hypothetical protein